MRRSRSSRKPAAGPSPGRLLRDRRGATAVEYGLIVAVIVIAMLASFFAVADVTKGMWNNVSEKVQNAR